jgi:urocanate hydratase
MTAALATTARFAKTKRLTVVKAGTGGGTVKSGPTGITCGTTCTHVFVAGTVVTLTATAKSGSRFTGWSGACSGTGTCSVTMNAAKAVTATFTRASASRRFSRKTVQTLARFEELLQRIAKQLEQWAS